MIAVARIDTRIQGEGGTPTTGAISIPIRMMWNDMTGITRRLIVTKPRINTQDLRTETGGGINLDLTTTVVDEKKNGDLVVASLPQAPHMTLTSVCVVNVHKLATKDPLQKLSERWQTIKTSRHSPRILLFRNLPPNERNQI